MSYPKTSPEELRRKRAAAEADGWRPGEDCACHRPDPLFVSVTRGELHYYLHGICGTCRRRVRTA